MSGYEVKVEGDVMVIRMDSGCDLFKVLVDACSKHGFKSGIIVSGIGQIKDLELGYMKVNQYLRKKFSETMELLSLQGSFAEETSGTHEISVHAHVTLIDEKFDLHGGHLFSATVGAMAEVTILHIPGMKREVLPSGLKLLRLE